MNIKEKFEAFKNMSRDDQDKELARAREISERLKAQSDEALEQRRKRIHDRLKSMPWLK